MGRPSSQQQELALAVGTMVLGLEKDRLWWNWSRGAMCRGTWDGASWKGL